MILLFGLPRSGTSWIGKIFDSHPETLYRHEPDSWCRARDIPIAPPVESLEVLQDAVKKYVGTIAAIRSARVSAKLPILPKSYYSTQLYLLRKFSAVGAQICSRYICELQVPEFISSQTWARITLVWKSIESVGRLGLFVRVLDHCRAILIVRHPCGQIASILRGESAGRFRHREPSSEDYGILDALLATEAAQRYGLTKPALITMHPVERLAWRWVLFNEKALVETEGLENCMILRYEDLCADPISITKQMFAFSELSWEDQTRKFLESSIRGDRGGYYSLAKTPLRSANKWRNDLSGEDIDRIIGIARRSRVGRLLLEC
jgi:hypothetical protein